MIAALLGYAGYDAADAEDAAERVYELEKRLAEPILRPEDFNDPGNYYHPRPVADLIAANPDFDWPAFLEVLGIPEQETVVVTELDYLERVDEILADDRSGDAQGLPEAAGACYRAASALSEEMGQTRLRFLRHDAERGRGAERRSRSARSATSTARSASPSASSTSTSISRRKRRRRSRSWSPA